MKVGLLTTGFPRFEGDHCGGFLLTVARGFVAGGHTVRVLAPEPDHKRAPPCWPGIEVRWVPYARPRSLQQTFYGAGAPDNLRGHPARWVGAATFTASLLAAAHRSLDECDALLSSWCVPCGWVASRVADGRDHLALCHETDVRWMESAPGGRALARHVASGSSALWFLSDAHRFRFFQRAGLCPSTTPSHVGAMPIDPPESPNRTREELRGGLEIDGFTLLFLGRLVPVKGVDQLLRAAAALGQPVHIRIAGDGPERQRLAALAERLGVDARFEGWVSGMRKEALLRACDAVVVPSREKEGLPSVLREAHARAVPIIATGAGAIPGAFSKGERVQLVAPGDTAALSRAIDALRAGRVQYPSAAGS